MTTIKETKYTIETTKEKVGDAEYSYTPADGVMYSNEPDEEDVKRRAYFEGMKNRFTRPEKENYYKALNDYRAELNNKAEDLYFVEPEENTYVEGDDFADVLADATVVEGEVAPAKKNDKDIHMVGPELTEFLTKSRVIDAKKHYNVKDLHYVMPKMAAPKKVEIPVMATPAPVKKHYNVKDLHYVQPVLTIPEALRKAMDKAAAQQALKAAAPVQKPVEKQVAEPVVQQQAPAQKTVEQQASKPAATPVQKSAEKQVEKPVAQEASATASVQKPAEKQDLGFDENSPLWQAFVLAAWKFQNSTGSRKLFDDMMKKEADILWRYYDLCAVHSADADSVHKMWDTACNIRVCLEKDQPLPQWWRDLTAKYQTQQKQAPKAVAPAQKPVAQKAVQPTPAKDANKSSQKKGNKYWNVGCGILTGLAILGAVIASYMYGSCSKKPEKVNTAKGVVVEKKVDKKAEANKVEANKVEANNVDDGKPRALTVAEQNAIHNTYVNNGTIINQNTLVNSGSISVGGKADGDGQACPTQKTVESASSIRVNPKPLSAGNLLGNTPRNLPQPMTEAENRSIQKVAGRGTVTKRIVNGHTVYVLERED